MLPDDPDSQAQLFYLIILGGAVLLWVMRDYAGKLSQAMQHAAIWALIFVGVIIAIGFKDVLIAQLFDDEPQRISDNTLVLKRDRSGQFYANVEVNGRDIRFLVDTGASDLVLSRQDAESAGIAMERLSFFITSLTANGEVKSAPVRLDSVAMGGFIDYDVPARVNGGELDVSLLGMTYLDKYQSLRVEGDSMYLTR
ncbi:MAG: TIGR02281 family clan AA aspartic protease [Pseudomonadota bacterium]